MLRGACLAKLPGVALRRLLSHLPNGCAPWEDSALVPHVDGTLLATIDFGPLICPEARTAGYIAALNAFSDIYAAGGAPLLALAMVVVDTAQPLDVAEEVLAGMAEACAAEGAILAGGHTVTGIECLAGLSVIGCARDGGVLRKSGAIPGDDLLLSKPLGVGLVLWGFTLGAVDDAGGRKRQTSCSRQMSGRREARSRQRCMPAPT